MPPASIGFHVTQRYLNEGRVVVDLDNLNDYYDPGLKTVRLEVLKSMRNLSLRVPISRMPLRAAPAFREQKFEVVRIDTVSRCGSTIMATPQQDTLGNWLNYRQIRNLCRSIVDATPASGLIRRVVGKETIYARRKRLASRYLSGYGIEFGALNYALDLPPNVKVRYADVRTADKLAQEYSSQFKKIVTPDIVTDIETMDCIDDCSVDFVVANHVVEHVENPFLAFRTIHRVLRSHGIAFIALPDKRFTFDRHRPITSLDHLKEDYARGPEWSRAGHYDEWAAAVCGFEGEERRDKVAEYLDLRPDIHFHVWDYDAMVEMFSYVASTFGFSIVHSEPNASEGIWILRKLGQGQR